MFRDYRKYEVFEDGRVYSYKSRRFLKPQKDRGGYHHFTLYDNNGKSKDYLVHRVVWIAVNGEIPEGYEINHKSERKDENFITNLELVDRKTNNNYGTRTARQAEKLSKQVAAYKDGVLAMTFPSTKEAGRQGYDSGNISKCCKSCYLREGNNTYKGYQWIYFEDSPPLFIDVA